LQTEGIKSLMMIVTPVLLYLKTKQFYKSTSIQLRESCDNFNVAQSTVRGQQCMSDSAYLLMSRDVIWTSHVQVFCIEI